MARSDIVNVAAMTPKLVVKLFFSYLRYKRKIKKAAKSFRKELIRSGMEKGIAKRLADEFLSSSDSISLRDISGFF